MTVKELDGAPRLATLYPKAALGGLRKGGGGAAARLPDTEFVRTGVVADPAHVAAYTRVCGFRLGDELPATYPHMAAFGLHLTLLTEPEFPFPLLGMVHVANRITQHRPLRIDDVLDLRVRAEQLRPHDKGTQFDVVSEATVAGEAVWTEVSTYLRRTPSDSAVPNQPSQPRLAPPSSSATWRVPGDIGRRYAEVSGDRNPIHLHPLTARLFGFPSAIAHGMWTKARVLAAFEGRLPDAYTVDVRFQQPVLLPAKVAFTSWHSGENVDFELWHARKPKPHLKGTITPQAR